MIMNNDYKGKVALLLNIAPAISQESSFAMHGGTAINLFVQDLPRYSVDIDLTYIQINISREESLLGINDKLKQIREKLLKRIPGIIVRTVANKLLCSLRGVDVKIEVNPIKRGLIEPAEERPLCERAQNDFGIFCKVKTVSISQLYGGKIGAALDRQHPRDMFDVKCMFDKGISIDSVKRGFIYDLLSGKRPFSEMLSPNHIDRREAMDNQFEGMSNIPFTYSDYEETRERLTYSIQSVLTDNDKIFLLDFSVGDPQWDNSEYAYFKDFPSVKWKQQNIQMLNGKSTKTYAGIRQIK